MPNECQLTQLPINVPRKAPEVFPSPPDPGTHVGDTAGAPSSNFQTGSPLRPFVEGTEQMRDLMHSLSLSLALPFNTNTFLCFLKATHRLS